ncbi:MAG TPA: RagB/SusD family nutrient uptake outer membrane protein [Ohtaekwangia sp.]|nr:RagB/SusD family nutrient uptake outer membrane protein [Ohtaekwangia sp.]
MKVNSIIRYSFVVVAIMLASCEDYFDAPSKSSLDESIIFSNYSMAKAAIDGILVPMAETNSYRGRFIPWYGMNTDVEWYNSSQTAGANADLCVYNAQPNNSQMNTVNGGTGAPDNAYVMMFQGIERANLSIRGLRTFGNPVPGSDMGQLLGEALTYRAVYYADLLKAWGDVPARFEPISGETLYLPRTSRDEIYNQLLKDLEEAATLVAWPNETASTSTVERPSKAFVKGLRARLALTAAGFSRYPDGQIRKGQLADFTEQQLYQIALDECEDVIESNTVHLEPSFEQLWRKYNQDVIAAGGESLWEIPFGDGRGRVLFTFAVRHNSNDQHHANGNNRGGQAGPLPFVFYDYDETDTRRDVTCVPYRYGNNLSSSVPISRQELVDLNTWYFGKYRYEWMNRFVTSSNDDGVNKMYMRYAEVLFLAAEAAYHLGQEGKAKTYLKEIRKRAFPASEHATKVDAYVDGLSGAALFNALVEEHKFEFCGEMERKQALIRWNLLGTKLDEAKTKMNDLVARTGSYSDVPTTLYYRYKSEDMPAVDSPKEAFADFETLEIYGLNRGETADPGAGWSSKSWNNLNEAKINSLYINDPDEKQFWPIWQVIVDGSNGMLNNDGY